MKYKSYINDHEYLTCVEEILNHQEFLRTGHFIQHGHTTTMDHCIFVSFYSYKFCKKYKLDYKAAARAGLLHDFFLYDWHYCRKEHGIYLHGFSHPKRALENANVHFALTDKEKDMIIKHMWPLTVIPPKTKEGYIVMLMDKYCGLVEIMSRCKKYLFTRVKTMP